MDRLSVPGTIVKRSLRHSLVVVAFAGLAIVAAGCADSRLAANDAASNNGQVQQSGYQVGYGLSSDGPTTDLYHEFKNSLQPPERPQATAAVQQGTLAPVNGQQVADSSPGPDGATQQPGAQQPVAQQPAAPPREQPTATMYGMTSDGPTTDVYTALFGRH